MLIPKTKQYCLQLSCSFSLKICPRTAKRHFQKKKEEEPADKDEKDEKDKDKGNKEKKNKWILFWAVAVEIWLLGTSWAGCLQNFEPIG